MTRSLGPQPRSVRLAAPRPSRRVPRSGRHGTPLAMTQHAPAKVNLFLEVLGKRADGYHELLTCMAALDLHDTLSFSPSQELSLTCDEPSLTTGPDNLILKAARLLQRHAGCPLGAAIHLTKRIPMEAGLGGGSSDAAAALRGLCALWELELPADELSALAAELGSDVPFFLAPEGAAWCTGRGETVAPFELKAELNFALLCPAKGVATAEAYRRLKPPAQPRSADAMRAALAAGDAAALGKALFNRLEEPAWALCPKLDEIRSLVVELSAASCPILGHQMSGSGSAYFVLCPSAAAAQKTAAAIRSAGERRFGQDDLGFSLLAVRTRPPRG